MPWRGLSSSRPFISLPLSACRLFCRIDISVIRGVCRVSDKTISGTASEMLSLTPVLAKFLRDLVVPAGCARPFVESALAMCTVLARGFLRSMHDPNTPNFHLREI